MRKLRKSEINRIIKENAALSNENLLNKYFDIIYHDEFPWPKIGAAVCLVVHAIGKYVIKD